MGKQEFGFRLLAIHALLMTGYDRKLLIENLRRLADQLESEQPAQQSESQQRPGPVNDEV
jgi:hypothetical protein